MSRVVEKSAKTVDEAVALALEELGITREEAVIEVLEEGAAKGFLGLGKKDAVVRVSEREAAEAPVAKEEEFVYYGDDEEENDDSVMEAEDRAVEFVAEILSGIGIHGKLDSYHQGNAIYIDVTGQDCGHAIGRGGDTLDAISYLTSLVANKGREDRVHVHLDIGAYKKRREGAIIEKAKKTASRVRRYGRALSLEAMNPAERRVVHFALQGFDGIRTHSEGDEPNRRIVITPCRKEKDGDSSGEE